MRKCIYWARASRQTSQMSIAPGDYCVLTNEGVNARRTRNRIRNAVVGAGVGWFALPLIIPGEAIGIAGASTFGVSEAAQAAVGSFIGGITGANFVKELSKGIIGQVYRIDNSPDSEPMAVVQWTWKQEDGKTRIVYKSHKLKHLQKVKPMRNG